MYDRLDAARRQSEPTVPGETRAVIDGFHQDAAEVEDDRPFHPPASSFRVCPVVLIRKFQTVALNWWSQRSDPTRALPAHLWRALLDFSQHGGRHAAALAYYTVFSLFPLSLLLAVGVSSLLGPTIAQEQITSGLKIFLPQDSISLLQENLTAALEQGGSFGLVAAVGLAWSALGLFSNISSSLDLIFHVPARRSLWRQRLLAFIMTITLIFLVMASFVTSGMLRLIAALLLDRPSVWVTAATSLLPLGLDVVIFALLFRYVPARRVSWDAVWPAAIMGAVGWELAKAAFEWYLTNLANFSLVYGGIATVIALMLWAYVIASVFLLSAELCEELDNWLARYFPPEEPARLAVRLDSGSERSPPQV